ncbi:MAG: hypothetical protein ABJA83_09730 [Burkholderiaceae bacterium]
MKLALLIGGLGLALAILPPALRVLGLRSRSRISDREYFAAARRRAIGYRKAKHAANDRESLESAGE